MNTVQTTQTLSIRIAIHDSKEIVKNLRLNGVTTRIRKIYTGERRLFVKPEQLPTAKLIVKAIDLGFLLHPTVM